MIDTKITNYNQKINMSKQKLEIGDQRAFKELRKK